MGLAWPTMRAKLAELGSRLVAAGGIEAVADVYWLTEAEANADAAALDGGATSVPDHRPSIDERRMTWRGQALATPPQYLPVAGWITLMDSMMPAHSGEQTGPTLKGTGGSGGTVTATARVLAGRRTSRPSSPARCSWPRSPPPPTPRCSPWPQGWSPASAGCSARLVAGPRVISRHSGGAGHRRGHKRIATGDVITVDGSANVVHLSGEPETAAPAGKAVPTWAQVAGAAAAAAGVVALVASRRKS